MTPHSIERASHGLCTALHMEHVDPADIEIWLPFAAWWRMQCRLEQLHRGLISFDGRGRVPESFRYMGITYRAKPQ
jgi:hypothetical protein